MMTGTRGNSHGSTPMATVDIDQTYIDMAVEFSDPSRFDIVIFGHWSVQHKVWCRDDPNCHDDRYSWQRPWIDADGHGSIRPTSIWQFSDPSRFFIVMFGQSTTEVSSRPQMP
jgi:hypothetical protein